jgi:hypothetical protein
MMGTSYQGLLDYISFRPGTQDSPFKSQVYNAVYRAVKGIPQLYISFWLSFQAN